MKRAAIARQTEQRRTAMLTRADLIAVTAGTNGTIIVQNLAPPPLTKIKETLVGD